MLMLTKWLTRFKLSIIIMLVAIEKFLITASSNKVSTNKCDTEGQQEIGLWGHQTQNVNISKNMTNSIKIPTTNSGFSVGISTLCHSCLDINISGFGDATIFPAVGHCCYHLDEISPADILFEFSVVINPRFAIGILIMLAKVSET